MRTKRLPAITRARGPAYLTPLQRRLADRELVILACHLQGFSVRFIASAFGLDPSYVSKVLDRIEERATKSTPEDSPKSLPSESFDSSADHE